MSAMMQPFMRDIPTTDDAERKQFVARLERLEQMTGSHRASAVGQPSKADADRDEVADVVSRMRYLEHIYRTMERR